MDTHHSQTKEFSKEMSKLDYIYYFKNGRKAVRDYFLQALGKQEALIKNGLGNLSSDDFNWLRDKFLLEEKQFLNKLNSENKNNQVLIENFKLMKWINTSEQELLFRREPMGKKEFLRTLYNFDYEQGND